MNLVVWDNYNEAAGQMLDAALSGGDYGAPASLAAQAAYEARSIMAQPEGTLGPARGIKSRSLNIPGEVPIDWSNPISHDSQLVYTCFENDSNLETA